MQQPGAITLRATRFATLHKTQRFTVAIHHGNRANIVIVHHRERFLSRRRLTYRQRRLLVGDIPCGNQQQTFQCTVLADKRADKLVRRFGQQLIRAGALHNTPLAEHRNPVPQL